MPKVLYIKLTQLHQQASNQKNYLSFYHAQQHYFSSMFNNKSNNQSDIFINDDIIIQVGQVVPQYLILHLWQNHMILFTHLISIHQLQTKTLTKKKCQTKQRQILSFTVQVINEEQMLFKKNYIEDISQHYLKVSKIQIKNQKNRVYTGPCYFIVASQSNKFYLPVVNSTVYVHIPTSLQFLYYRTGELFGKSQTISFNSIKESTVQLTLQKQGYYKGQLLFEVQWGINLRKTKIENTLLIESHQIIIYDIETKFDNFNEFANCKVKIGYGNKAFQLVGDYNSNKVTKFKKIIYFMIKSEQEEILIMVEKNAKIFAQTIFLTDQILTYQVNTINKKIIQNNGRVIGSIKFKCQKAKNLSLPTNNELWKEINKKKTTAVNTILCIDQVSAKYTQNQQLMVTAKANQIQYKFYPIVNFNFFEDTHREKEDRALISIKPEETIYFIIRKYQKDNKTNVGESDFIGIAVLNSDNLRLGQSIINLPFFKNQQQTASLSIHCNKIIPHQFLKSIFIPEPYNSISRNTINISLFINKITLTPYFYTYNYDGKNQLYCISEVNRVKKVLILSSVEHDQLTFYIADGSDSLSYQVDETQFTKIKFIFLVSDFGHEEQIYASSSIKVKTSQLSYSKPTISFNNIILKNYQGNEVGKLSIEVTKIIDNKVKLPTNLQKKGKNNKSLQISAEVKQYKGIQPKNQSRRYTGSSNQRYSQEFQPKTQRRIKLPLIKQKKNDDKLQKVFSMLKVRKRGAGGIYDQTHNSNSFQAQQYTKIQDYIPPVIGPDKQFTLKSIQKNNPNLNKNFQMLFPKRVNERKNRIRQHQEQKNYKQLRGLKSVYQEISNDIKEVQPTIKSSRLKRKQVRKTFYQSKQYRVVRKLICRTNQSLMIFINIIVYEKISIPILYSIFLYARSLVCQFFYL